MIVINNNLQKDALISGKYHDQDVLFYNSNEVELVPDYDYQKHPLKVKSYTEVTGDLYPKQYPQNNTKFVSWPYFWLIDTVNTCWDIVNSGVDPDQYWQTSRLPTQLYTCMLGQKRPHRQMIWDLLLSHKCMGQYVTFVGQGIYRDVVQPFREDIQRCEWKGENQQKTHRFPPWYDLCLIDLVVETHEDHTFFTEKTWKPFLGMRLPMIFGNKFMMDPLMEWGFHFPGHIINYDYDKEPNPYLRARGLVRELKRLREEHTLQELHEETLECRKHNQRRCFEILEEIDLPTEVPRSQKDIDILEKSLKIKKDLDLFMGF